MPTYNLIEYSDKYSKTAGSLWQYCKDVPNHPIKQSESFKFKLKFLENTNTTGIINGELAVPLKNLRNFWITLEILLIDCEFNLILTWSEKCVLSEGNRATTFKITDTKLYVPVVTLSTQDNVKLLEQLKVGSRRTISWNKYQSKVTLKLWYWSNFEIFIKCCWWF